MFCEFSELEVAAVSPEGSSFAGILHPRGSPTYGMISPLVQSVNPLFFTLKDVGEVVATAPVKRVQFDMVCRSVLVCGSHESNWKYGNQDCGLTTN